MFPRKEKLCVGTALVLAAVFALTVAAPAGAIGWGDWRKAWSLEGEFLVRAMVWLRLTPDSRAVLKCDDGGSIDPNGNCRKAEREHRSQVEMNGAGPDGPLPPAWRP